MVAVADRPTRVQRNHPPVGHFTEEHAHDTRGERDGATHVETIGDVLDAPPGGYVFAFRPAQGNGSAMTDLWETPA